MRKKRHRLSPRVPAPVGVTRLGFSRGTTVLRSRPPRHKVCHVVSSRSALPNPASEHGLKTSTLSDSEYLQHFPYRRSPILGGNVLLETINSRGPLKPMSIALWISLGRPSSVLHPASGLPDIPIPLPPRAKATKPGTRVRFPRSLILAWTYTDEPTTPWMVSTRRDGWAVVFPAANGGDQVGSGFSS